MFPEAAHGYSIWNVSPNVNGAVNKNSDTCAFKYTECAHPYTETEFLDCYHAFRSKYPGAAA